MELHRDLTISYRCPQISLISEIADTYTLYFGKNFPDLYCMCFDFSCLCPARRSRDSSRQSHYTFLWTVEQLVYTRPEWHDHLPLIDVQAALIWSPKDKATKRIASFIVDEKFSGSIKGGDLGECESYKVR